MCEKGITDNNIHQQQNTLTQACPISLRTYLSTDISIVLLSSKMPVMGLANGRRGVVLHRVVSHHVTIYIIFLGWRADDVAGGCPAGRDNNKADQENKCGHVNIRPVHMTASDPTHHGHGFVSEREETNIILIRLRYFFSLDL